MGVLARGPFSGNRPSAPSELLNSARVTAIRSDPSLQSTPEKEQRMDVARLEAFVTVVEIESFTRAAARLNLSQPTVTARIKSLETQLGTPLLERLPKGIRPTSAGAELLPLARNIIRLTRQAKGVARAGRHQPSGRLSVGSTECLTASRLLPLIEYVYLRYPALEIDLYRTGADDSIAGVQQGDLDCALFIDVLRDVGDLQRRVLCPEPLSVLASPRHALLAENTVTPDELRRSTWVRCDNGAHYHQRLMESLGGEWPRTFVLDSIDATKSTVANGVGLSIIPSAAVETELAEGTLAEVPWRPRTKTYTQMVWRRDSAETGAVAALIDDITRIVEEDARPGR
ncbi:LysR family transcriptional regulator [Actinomadura hibisca]|uniref:LysR family transcriptional regulator n=1 Tax=Actinomadura hibisca TaxID=68565 RepID=UPI000A0610D3|nr:LysR family transcriptional regulator [Actinomadura hibisca]